MARHVTIDHLAEMVAKGFQNLRREMLDGFASIRAILDDHGETLADHSHRLDRIERKLDNTIERVDTHNVRLERLEKRRRV